MTLEFSLASARRMLFFPCHFFLKFGFEPLLMKHQFFVFVGCTDALSPCRRRVSHIRREVVLRVQLRKQEIGKTTGKN